MGSSLFFLYSFRGDTRREEGKPASRGLFALAAGVLAGSALLGLLAQTALLAGSLPDAMTREALSAVASGTNLGKAALVRAAAAILALLVVVAMRRPLAVVAALGIVAAATLPWMGHGAVTEGTAGWFHLGADLLHAWAAAVWVGALAALLFVQRGPKPEILHQALHGFSSVGTLAVAVLVGTGAINSWFLVGIDRIGALWTTPYGQLLSLKLLLFVGMLGLASANRFRLTPALGRAVRGSFAPDAELAALRLSVWLEAALGFCILALVAWLGTLDPPAAL
jgi:putative copper resistance protein D